MRSVRAVGVHPVDPSEADQPCHLIELDVCDPGRAFIMDDVVQVDERVGKEFWQAAYVERFLDARSLQPLPELERPDRTAYQVALFLHDLDVAKPLETSFGPVALPQQSPRPRSSGVYGIPSAMKRASAGLRLQLV